MKNLFNNLVWKFKKLIFRLFIKYSNDFLTETEAVVFAEKVMRIEYSNRFFPVKEIAVKKGKIKYTLLVSSDGKEYNLGRHNIREIEHQIN